MPEDLSEGVPEPTARYVGGAGAGARAGEHVVAPKNRWARAILSFHDLVPEAWYALAFTLAWDAEEQAGAALDFALVGFDFMASDGSSLDVEAVPGLVRTLPDPLGAWLPGPVYHGGAGRVAALRLGFRMPAPASDLALGFRSWRNTAPFRIADVSLRRVEAVPAEAPPPRLRLGAKPLVLAQDLVPGIGLVLRGQIVSDRPDEHAAYALIRYRVAAGVEMPLPYPDLLSVPGHGASVNLPAKPQARRFTLSLNPPSGAARVEIGLLSAGDQPDVEGQVRLGQFGTEAIEDARQFIDRAVACRGAEDA